MPHARPPVLEPVGSHGAAEPRVGSSSATPLLFVDDDPNVRRSFHRVGRRLGFDVDLAAGAAEALRLAQTRAYPVVVTDVRMPDVDGITLVQRLSSILPDTSYVFSTGVAALNLPDDDVLNRAVCGVLQKPWNRTQLEQTLTRAVELHTAKSRGNRRPRESARALNVLLIEDNPGGAELTQEHLNEQGITLVTQAVRLREALELDQLYDGSFEVVLTDLSLPDARGLDAVTRVQAAAPDAAVVVLSSIVDETLALKALELGAQDFLVKAQLDGPTLERSLRFALQRKRAEQRLARLAHYDQLTGLPNRMRFLEHLEQRIARARRKRTRLCVMFLDLDRFKQINDSLGHDVGDSLLVRVAQALANAVRTYDLVARLGGDEFAIVVDDLVDEQPAREVAQRILQTFETRLDASGMELDTSASIGMALFPDAASSAEGLLRAADAAMYMAKSAGRNRCHLHGSDAPDRAAPRLALAQALRSEPAATDFLLHFQPEVALESGETVAYEALLRWKRGETLLAAQEFLDALEETGRVREVGLWAIDQVCRSLAERRSSGMPLFRIGVNVSNQQLDETFVERVLDTLAHYQLPPDTLELEVSETALLDLAPAARQALADSTSAGLRLALDGFGQAYASLACLERFPGDVLKLDRSLLVGLAEEPGRVSLIANIIELAHSRSLSVVASGVETSSQLEILTRHGCDLAQGYLLGKPGGDWDDLRGRAKGGHDSDDGSAS